MSSICNGVFSELLLEGKLCDTVIRVSDVEFKVHRIILSSCSSYFRDLFCSKLSTSEQQVYSFPHVSPNIMSLILEYAYTHSVVVTEENVLELLAGADIFAVKGVMQACCNFLEGQLSFKNCIDIWRLANCHSCSDLTQKAYLYILHHFEEVAGLSANFLHLSVEQLADFIEKDELSVRQESAVFEAILRWINYAPEERRGHLATLLSKVRLLLMPIEYLVSTVSTNALVRKSPPCLTMMINTMRTLRESNLGRPLTQTRLPSAVLLAVSGFEEDNPTSRIELYNVRTECWMTVSNSKEAQRAFHSCVFLNGFIYYIGGFDAVDYISSVQRLNLITQTWQEVGPMHTARCNVSAVVLNGCIYAMGGCDRYERLNTAERYKPDTNQWTLIAPMHERRSDASAATLHGKVYICGGFKWDEPLSTAECYNPQTNQWTVIAPMEIGRYAAGVIAYQDQIYVVGGYNGIRHTNSVTAYNPLSNCWHMVTPMINSRSNFGIGVLEDQLYVAGGFDGHGAISKVERYDIKTKKWYSVQDMEIPRVSVSCCVVDRNPYALFCHN
ncbi:kelch-like protein 10 [Lates japonicus]|uniref:Kelch-like protein 10 n=1 Tax=Lates japonicus TaxID=270547 RepID=A0AAD3NAR1_LATJO|nr:kelch-like protein 10 [Lates japonicus]